MSNNTEVKFDEASDCACGRKDVCGLFSEFMQSLKSSNLFSNQSKIKEILKKDDISLATKFCWGKSKSILKTLLEEVPEGCHIIKSHLDELFSINYEREEPSSIDICIGKLFEQDRPGEQSRILKELLSIRNRCINSGGRSYEALNGLIQHPAIAIFILEKWSRVKLSFFIHLR